MGPDPPLISVVVPVYDNGAGIRRTLEALAGYRGECTSLEVIVVDDGSADDTARVATAALGPFDRSELVSTLNRGPSAARNTGAAAASGAYLVFLDTNDEPLAGWLGSFAARARTGVGVAHCRPLVSDPGVRPADRYYLPGCFAIERRLFLEIGGYDEQLRFAENTDLVERTHVRCAMTGRAIAHDRRPLIAVHDVSDPRRYDAHRAAAMIHLLGREDDLRHDRGRRERLASIGAVCSMRIGDVATARRLAWVALQAGPAKPRNWIRVALSLAPWIARRRWPTRRHAG